MLGSLPFSSQGDRLEVTHSIQKFGGQEMSLKRDILGREPRANRAMLTSSQIIRIVAVPKGRGETASLTEAEYSFYSLFSNHCAKFYAEVDGV